MAKKTIANELATALGAAAGRVETTLKPKRGATVKHSKAKVLTVEEPVQQPPTETITAVGAKAGANVDLEEVALVAFLRWESRGYQGGSPEEDWLIAEQEVKAKAAAK